MQLTAMIVINMEATGVKPIRTVHGTSITHCVPIGSYTSACTNTSQPQIHIRQTGHQDESCAANDSPHLCWLLLQCGVSRAHRQVRSTTATRIQFDTLSLSRPYPGSGNIITFAQFIFIAIEGFFNYYKWGTAQRRVPLK